MVERRAFLSVAAGGLLGEPFRSHAQTKTPRIGFLTGGPAAAPGRTSSWFEDGLTELGYLPGRNIVIEYRAAEGRMERLPGFAAELVAMPVDIIVLGGPAGLPAALAATKRIPIVMLASSSDPVGEGLVKSLARPGGNLTGLTYAEGPERFGKQLEFLKQAAPRVARVAVFWDFDLAAFHRDWAKPLEAAARQLSLQILPPTQVLERGAVEGAVAAMKADRADAILVVMGGPTSAYREHVAAVALQHRLPAIGAFKEFTRAGGLLSYGPDLPALARRGAAYVDRILKGAPAGSLPIELPRYELALNRTTARALGLALPQSLLLRADEVFE